MGVTDLQSLSMDELRARRATARRSAEVAHVRARQGGLSTPAQLAGLDTSVASLTEELICRYAEDLTLVDSLLEASYPAKVTSTRQAPP